MDKSCIGKEWRETHYLYLYLYLFCICICISFVTYVKFCGQKLYRKRVEADSLLAIKEFTLTFQFEFCYGKKMYLIFYLLFFTFTKIQPGHNA